MNERDVAVTTRLFTSGDDTEGKRKIDAQFPANMIDSDSVSPLESTTKTSMTQMMQAKKKKKKRHARRTKTNAIQDNPDAETAPSKTERRRMLQAKIRERKQFLENFPSGTESKLSKAGISLDAFKDALNQSPDQGKKQQLTQMAENEKRRLKNMAANRQKGLSNAQKRNLIAKADQLNEKLAPQVIEKIKQTCSDSEIPSQQKVKQEVRKTTREILLGPKSSSGHARNKERDALEAAMFSDPTNPATESTTVPILPAPPQRIQRRVVVRA